MKKIHLLTVTVLLCLGMFSQTLSTSFTYSVHLPASKTSKPPVLILLHGYGSNESDLFELAHSLDSRFLTFSLRAPNLTKNGGFCWYDLAFLPNQQFQYNYQQAIESRKQILAFIRQACKAYKADSNQVFVLGFSQGAIMSYELALSAPGKIKGVVALSGRMMEETKNIPTDWSKVEKVKFFIAHGLSDNVIKFEDGEKAHTWLSDKKIKDLTFHHYEMPHSISGRELNDIRAWLTKSITTEQKKPTSK